MAVDVFGLPKKNRVNMKFIQTVFNKIFPYSLVGTKNEKTRQTWLGKVLSSMPEGGRILDAGAGELRNKDLCSHLKYVSQDFCQYDGAGNAKGLQTEKWNTSNINIVSDIINIPEPDNSFDVVLCSEVFEHLPMPVAALNELGRLVKSGGHLILTAPFCSLTHFAPYHYSTGFNRYFYEEHLQGLGFDILDLQANGNYFEYMGQEIRRISGIANKYSPNTRNSYLGKFVGKVSKRIMLNKLQKLSNNDIGSSELLCFGYHILARKKRT